MSFSPVATPLGWIGRNRILALALLLASVLSLGGAGWGRVECWNVDEMAFRGTQSNGLPWGYLKPPLHTYLNHLLIMKPAEAVRTVLGLERSWQFPVQLWGTRLLTLALFLGMLLLLHRTAARLAGRRGAAVIVLLAATSAGLIKFNHFATCDSPLLFWMVASFALAVRAALTGRRSDAFLAGLLAGLATADKYNGLGVAAAIPAVLLAARGWRGLLGSLPWMGLLGVPAGFFLGNPGCVFDTRNFVQDFLYNLYTTPVYNGETKGTGYVDFLLAFPELVGWPGSLLLLGAVGASVGLLLLGRLPREERILLLGAGAVFLFYFVTIGRFPRMADRFVLPVVPFVLLLAAPALQRLRPGPLPVAALGLLLLYNLFCSAVLDLRFLSDPRLRAQDFAIAHFRAGTTVENSYAPWWDRLPGLGAIRITTLPCATGRAGTFGTIFGSNDVIRKGVEKNEVTGYRADTFTAAGLSRRHPDYVAFSNQVFQFTGDDQAQRFYAALDRGEAGYRKVFEAVWMPRVTGTYPRGVDFLVERMVILERNDPGDRSPR